MEELTEKGFVFIDDYSKPFFIRMWSGVPWLFYWHPDKKWVSLRKVSQTEIWQFHEKVLSEEMAEIYHKANAKQFPSS